MAPFALAFALDFPAALARGVRTDGAVEAAEDGRIPLDGRDTWEVEYSSIALNLRDGNYEPLNAIEDL